MRFQFDWSLCHSHRAVHTLSCTPACLLLCTTHQVEKITCHSLVSCPSATQTWGCKQELMLPISLPTPGIKGKCWDFRAGSWGILYLSLPCWSHAAGPCTIQGGGKWGEMGAISQLQVTANLPWQGAAVFLFQGKGMNNCKREERRLKWKGGEASWLEIRSSPCCLEPGRESRVQHYPLPQLPASQPTPPHRETDLCHKVVRC